jgi:uncharacterized protein YktB (UPF0637 family)
MKSGLGLVPADYAVFEIDGFDRRMAAILRQVRPKLVRIADELAPELGHKLSLELYPHVARHARRLVNPPPETWAAFGPSPRGYKRWGYLALCVSAAGLHARVAVKAEAESRPQMGAAVAAEATELAGNLKGVGLARYDRWNFRQMPAEVRPDAEFFRAVAETLARKTGGMDLGFGWRRVDAVRLDPRELLDAYRELAPLYRLLSMHA